MSAEKKAKPKAKAKPKPKPKPKATVIDPLFARVLADPDDAALRQVWADALIEKGDPRGELIAIQVAAGDKPLTPAQDKRMRSLIFEHREAWLGDLAGVLQHREGLVFDRGVLDKCQIQIKNLDSFKRAIGHPLWSTMRSMWFCDKFAWDPRSFELLAHPVCRRVRDVWAVGANLLFPLLALSATPLSFESIWTIDDHWRAEGKAEEAMRTLGATPGLPHLKRLGFETHYDVDYILQLPVIDRIETLGLTVQSPVGGWLEETKNRYNLTTIEIRDRWIAIQGPQRSHWVIRVHRSPATKAWSHMTITPANRPNIADLEAQLKSIKVNSIERIEMRMENKDESLRPSLKRFKHAEIVVNDKLLTH